MDYCRQVHLAEEVACVVAGGWEVLVDGWMEDRTFIKSVRKQGMGDLTSICAQADVDVRFLQIHHSAEAGGQFRVGGWAVRDVGASLGKLLDVAVDEVGHVHEDCGGAEQANGVAVGHSAVAA